jgi:hypothetical protein
MRITRIDIEGETRGRFARITRREGSDFIEVQILCPGLERGHCVAASNRDGGRDDQWSMAECLQETLDGYRGTNGDIHDYFSVLERFAD